MLCDQDNDFLMVVTSLTRHYSLRPSVTLSSDLTVQETHESTGFGSVIGNITVSKVYKSAEFGAWEFEGKKGWRGRRQLVAAQSTH